MPEASGPDDPPEPGMWWAPPSHVVGTDLGWTCVQCGQHTALAPPCIPGRWYHLTPVTTLATQQIDGRGSE